jgi:hypothetical protein
MNIKEIAKRESFVTQFTWAQADAPESFLFNMRVDPCMFSVEPGSPSEYFLTASAAAATPFKYWTGSMKVRFQFVCSAYHKGRIKIVYDPNYIDSSASTYNTNYVHVVDISEKQDFTVEIGPAQTTTLMEHVMPGIATATTIYDGLNEFTSKGLGNGVLGVYVINELTTPNSIADNDIQVNVFVSMGDDFEVFVPDNRFQQCVWDRLSPQSGEVVDPTEHKLMEEDKPQQSGSTTIGKDEIHSPDLNLVFTGESITSFRQMIKRYNHHALLTNVNSVNYPTIPLSIHRGRRPAFPYLRGYVAGAVDTTAVGDNYNYCNTVMLHWVTMMFQGWRGSIRWKFVPYALYESARPILEVQRFTDDAQASLYQNVSYSGGSFSLDSNRALSAQSLDPVDGYPNPYAPMSGGNGSLLFNGYVNNAAEFEVPYYSRERFTPGKRENYMIDDNWHSDAFDFSYMFGGESTGWLHSWCAAGEDFQVYFFTGMPGLFFETTPPAA